jgi:hypothetical protein
VYLLQRSGGNQRRDISCVSRILGVEYVIMIRAFALALREWATVRELEGERRREKEKKN